MAFQQAQQLGGRPRTPVAFASHIAKTFQRCQVRRGRPHGLIFLITGSPGPWQLEVFGPMNRWQQWPTNYIWRAISWPTSTRTFGTPMRYFVPSCLDITVTTSRRSTWTRSSRCLDNLTVLERWPVHDREIPLPTSSSAICGRGSCGVLNKNLTAWAFWMMTFVSSSRRTTPSPWSPKVES